MKTIGWLFLLTVTLASPAAAQYGGCVSPDCISMYYGYDAAVNAPPFYCRRDSMFYNGRQCTPGGHIRRFHYPEHYIFYDEEGYPRNGGW